MAEEAAVAAGGTAGSLKIGAKKRRQVGSPLLVLSGTLHFFPSSVILKAPVSSISDPFMERNTCGFGQKIACLFPKSLQIRHLQMLIQVFLALPVFVKHKTRRIFFELMQIVVDAALLSSGGSLKRQKLPLDFLLQPGLCLK